MSRRPALVAAWVAIAAAVLSGCVTLPESGPVVDAGNADSTAEEATSRYVPNPPEPGATATTIVREFFEAMTATPIQTNSAQEFLTEEAQGTWAPEEQTIVYAEAAQPRASSQTRVSVQLTDAYRLDSRGVFTGLLAQSSSTQLFRMEIEEDEWRIAQLPDALIVPRTWTDEQFRSVDVYYFDPTARILVPEPATIPRGEQFATAVTRSLLAGPGASLTGVSRNFLPSELTLGLSVPVDEEGVADVALQGDASAMSPEEAALAAVQLAWTLRQDPSIASIRLTANGQALPGLPIEVPVAEGAEYDPADLRSSSTMFALRDGQVVSGAPTSMTAVPGRAGQRDYGFTSLAVSLDATRVAGIAGNGSRVLVGPTSDPEGALQQVVGGATSLLAPAWDAADRIWLVDRTVAGGRVSVVVDGRPQSVDVPRITGADVRHFLVSRDGSRLIAAVRRRRGDFLVAARIRYDDRGLLTAVTPGQPLPWPNPELPRIRDLTWRTPTSVAVLYPIRDQAQVRTLAVDGSPAALSIASSTLSGDFRYLIGAPDPEGDLYAATRQGFTDLSEAADRSTAGSDVDLSTLTYSG